MSQIKITDIVPSPFQKRTEFSNIESLAADIKSQGLLSPIIVRSKPVPQSSPNKYELIAGERRLRAYQLLSKQNENYSEIEATVRKDCSDDEAQSIHLSENLQREGITPLEEAAELEQLLEHCTLKQAAEYLGRSAGWIAQRANLSKLCTKFKAAYAKDDKIKMWPIESLELVARMPDKVQEDILDNNKFEIPTVKELQKEIAGRIMKLSSTTWAKDSDDCKECQKRTAAAPDLFSEINVEKDDRCLDANCWGKHTEAALTAKADEFKQSGKKLVTVINGYNEFDSIPAASDVKQGALRDWEFKKVKQGTKGAVPALVVGGSGVGETIFIQPNENNTGGTAATKGPKSMKEKREGLEKRREIAFTKKVIDNLEAAYKKPPSYPLALLHRLCAAFGGDPIVTKATTWDPFKRYEETKMSDDGCAEMFKCVIPKIMDRLNAECTGQTVKATYAEQVCEWFDMSSENIKEAVLKEIPEPKSWAKENETKPDKSETKALKKETKSVDFETKRYIFNGQEIFISAGLGGSEYGTFRVSDGGSGIKRIVAKSMPMVKDKDEAQRNLEAFAAEKFLPESVASVEKKKKGKNSLKFKKDKVSDEN
jgi:ParB/RepB/Spo0J family partition protein